jgi:hypothetical protein
MTNLGCSFDQKEAVALGLLGTPRVSTALGFPTPQSKVPRLMERSRNCKELHGVKMGVSNVVQGPNTAAISSSFSRAQVAGLWGQRHCSDDAEPPWPSLAFAALLNAENALSNAGIKRY